MALLVYVVTFKNKKTLRLLGVDEAQVREKVAPYLEIARTKIVSVEPCLECQRKRQRGDSPGGAAAAARGTLPPATPAERLARRVDAPGRHRLEMHGGRLVRVPCPTCGKAKQRVDVL